MMPRIRPRAARPAMLDHEAINTYAPLKPANGRMRAIMDDIFGQNLGKISGYPPPCPTTATHDLARR